MDLIRRPLLYGLLCGSRPDQLPTGFLLSKRKEDKAFFMLRGRVAQLLEFCISNLIYQNMYVQWILHKILEHSQVANELPKYLCSCVSTLYLHRRNSFEIDSVKKSNRIFTDNCVIYSLKFLPDFRSWRNCWYFFLHKFTLRFHSTQITKMKSVQSQTDKRKHWPEGSNKYIATFPVFVVLPRCELSATA